MLAAVIGERLQAEARREQEWKTWCAHPASPTAIEITSVVAARSQTTTADHLTRLAAAYLGYLRPGHELQDARQIALAFALWAGDALAALMHHDTERINGYTAARAH
ncbi:hypothetical protein ACWD4N_48715 [Streptomyces sp. NPDC002586]